MKPQQDFTQLIQQEIRRQNQRSDSARQYTVTSIPIHTHNNVDSPQVDYVSLGNVGNYLTMNTVSLTSAQIKTLNTVPVVLVPPPLKKQVIIVHSITVRFLYGGTAYTGTHNLEFHYTNGAGTQVTDAIPPSFFNATTNGFYHAPAVTTSFAPIEGGTAQNGQIVAFVNTANPAAGNGTMVITTHYHYDSFFT
jgi:hypothetical protein